MPSFGSHAPLHITYISQALNKIINELEIVIFQNLCVNISFPKDILSNFMVATLEQKILQDRVQ